ncbi:ergothioneine biosynthesis protein EgtB [Flavobacterium agrisoli]|uniref:Ergothioneine biosynthesis protein EgtB n=1 Tax=Flavobacterium agrisoli TaxID=2793066 RepID=A0A934PK68_9FLAO|nr:ergothioneine biosynthesis protein EgtB [Flavobacterium agrisoli]MBK0368389.1 ergothioneine biosynthesis protein EgtB [Flavobacterium agrisoli]
MIARFLEIRQKTEAICSPLCIEDYSVQPSEFASPPKWHLAHTTWFWEEFVLTKYDSDYVVYHPDFSYLFNSYYNTVGKRVLRPTRGLMTRPPVEEVYAYRTHVSKAMELFLKNDLSKEVLDIIEIGLNHEQQHQELLVYDIKYLLGMQPTFPIYGNDFMTTAEKQETGFVSIKEGIYEIGHQGESFCFDNELGRHKVYITDFEISKTLVTNGDYLEFINQGGYQNFNYWHDEGWGWVNENKIEAPLYWHKIENDWYQYTLNGFEKVNPDFPVMHLSYYEAFAYAEWKAMRLPTEFEWEVASTQLQWGKVWEWTNSAYLAYPNFNKAAGALGEYNGKFMVNQMVLRGASIATPENHSRKTYRNFFQANMRWHFSGLRLVK